MTGNKSGAHPLTNPELTDRRGNDPFIFISSQGAVTPETPSAPPGATTRVDH
jgi:hypothetical protein